MERGRATSGTHRKVLSRTRQSQAETVLDVEMLTQDDSQMLVEDGQPRKLENMLEIQGADTVVNTTDYFVWFDLELGTAWRSSTGSPPEQAVTLQVPENARGWSSVVGVWSDGWRHEIADISVDEYQQRRTVSSSPTPSVPCQSRRLPQSRCGLEPTHVLARRSRWSAKARRPHQIGGDRSAEKWLFGRATSPPSFDGT